MSALTVIGTRFFSRLKTVMMVFAALVSALLPAAASASSPTDKPFKRSMTMTGGDLDIFVFLGQYDALEDAGLKPDLIIASCGGSMAATIISAFPDRDKRMEFIHSPTILGYLQNIKYTDASLYRLIAELKQATHRNADQLNPATRTVPKLDPGFSVMSPSNSYRYKELRTGFERTGSKAPEVVLIANRRLYTLEDAGKRILNHAENYPNGHHLYREVLFTSSRVAKLLEGTQSQLGLKMRKSFIGPDREIITGANMNDAMIHSSSDPFYLAPSKTWTTGAINLLSAIEISRLAEENYIGYHKLWTQIDIAVLQENFGFNPVESDTYVVDQKATGWMDMTVDSYDSLAQKVKFSPSLRSWPSGFVRLTTNIPRGPNALKTFRRLVDLQYQAGVEQVRTMLALPKGSKTHIKEPYHSNASKKIAPRIH